MSDPQNFDQMYNGNSAFTIGGVTFHWRPLHWREWGELLDRSSEEQAREEKERQKKIEALVKKGMDRDEAEFTVYDEETVVERFEKLVARCGEYLEPSELESFAATMNDTSKRISHAQLSALLVWLQEVQTPDRPTETPASSSPGPGTTGAISPAA